MTHQEILGLVATLIGFVGYVPYFWGIYKGRVKPHVFSWLVWAVLTAIAFVAQWTQGAGAGSWVTGFTCVICFVVAGLALFRGEKNITRSDWFSFVAALTAIPVWIATRDPLLSVVMVTVIDMLGFYPTFRKSWLKPHEEALAEYWAATIKFAIALFALESFTLVTALYPASLVFAHAAFIAMALYRRRVLAAGTVGA